MALAFTLQAEISTTKNMGFVYTKKKDEKDEKTINVVEYVDRMFNQQKKEEQVEQPKIESTK